MALETQKTSLSSASSLSWKIPGKATAIPAILVAGTLFVGLMLYFRIATLPWHQIHQQHIHENKHIAEQVLRAYTALNEISQRQPGVSIPEHVLKPLRHANSISQALLLGGEQNNSRTGHIYKSRVKRIRLPEAREALQNTSRAIQEFTNQVIKHSDKPATIKSRFNLAHYRRLTRDVEANVTRFETAMEYELKQIQKRDALLADALIFLSAAIFLGAIFAARRGRNQIRDINKKLIESVEYNSAIVDTAVEGILVTDKQGIIQFARSEEHTSELQSH